MQEPAQSSTVHATAVVIQDKAVLIRGASGSGKSGLALELIALGAVLVSDDRVRLMRSGDAVIASAPESIAGLIEARGLGILRLPYKTRAAVALIVDLDQDESERLPPERRTEVLGRSLPCVYGSSARYFPAGLHAYMTGKRYA